MLMNGVTMSKIVGQITETEYFANMPILDVEVDAYPQQVTKSCTAFLYCHGMV